VKNLGIQRVLGLAQEKLFDFFNHRGWLEKREFDSLEKTGFVHIFPQKGKHTNKPRLLQEGRRSEMDDV
jgi:hypothetical protein